MSGFSFRIGAAAVVCAAATVVCRADPARVEPVTIPYPSLDVAVAQELPAAPAQVVPPMVPAPPAATTAIPLPAGVYIGLFGLASAAIARRRYLKRR